MNTYPEGWTTTEYKSFKTGDSDSETESESEEVPVSVRGYRKEKYKKILFVEELLPE